LVDEPDEIVKVKIAPPCAGDTIIVGGLVYPLPPFISVTVLIKIVGDEPVYVKLHVAPEPPPPVIVKNCGIFRFEYLPPLVIVIDVTLPPALPPPPPPSC
jgi:hypothetical protein